jgi:CARDB/Kelch motif
MGFGRIVRRSVFVLSIVSLLASSPIGVPAAQKSPQPQAAASVSSDGSVPDGVKRLLGLNVNSPSTAHDRFNDAITATSNINGYYTLTGLIADTYTITPSKSGYIFSPASRTVSVPPNATGQDFAATQTGIISWTYRASMRAPRKVLMAVTADNGRIYAIGGQEQDCLATKTVEEYNPTTDSWRIRASLMTATWSAGAALANGKIYIIGGAPGCGTTYSSAVQEYDPSTDTWRTRASMPTQRENLVAATVNGKIYAIGGVKTNNMYVAIPTVEEYDPQTNTWRARANMPAGRASAGATVFNGKIFVVGGSDQISILGSVFAYDPAADSWQQLADMLTPQSTLAVIQTRGMIYAIGGVSDSQIVRTVQQYDPTLNTWAMSTPLLHPRYYLAAEVSNGRLFVIGGWAQPTGTDPLGGTVEEAIFAPSVTAPALMSLPASVPGNGTSTTSVTLSGAPPGHQVRLISSRGSIDMFGNLTGNVASNGQFMTTLRSTTPGTAILTAQDLTTGQTFGTSAQVTFTGSGNPLPPSSGAINVTDVKAQYPLDAHYLEGVPAPNRIDVTVDWKGAMPGHVDFTLNDATVSEPASTSGASHAFNMGSDLKAGSNSLRIVAYNATGQSSSPLIYTVWSTTLPAWLSGLVSSGLTTLPQLVPKGLSGSANFEATIHLPPYTFDLTAPSFGSGGETKLSWDFTGKLSIPLYCVGPWTTEAEASASATGLKLLGADTEVKGLITGKLEAKPIGVCVWDNPEGNVGVAIEGNINVVHKPLLVVIAYFNAELGVIVDEMVVSFHAEDLVSKVLGEFYIDAKPHVGLDWNLSLINQPPFFLAKDVGVSGGFGVEGGYRWELPFFEAKAWVGADGSVRYSRSGVLPWPPNAMHFDSLTLSGEIGAIFRSGWFERSVIGKIQWTYPPTATVVNRLSAFRDLSVSDWHLSVFPRTPDSRESYARFVTPPLPLNSLPSHLGTGQAFAAPRYDSTTITSTLVSNIYRYPEPSLAVNPVNNNALLLWVHDDINKPVGQSQEINNSLWNGSTWSTPTGVTSDTLLDGAPQVAWMGDGNAVAVWQRLNDTLPVTATWDVTTANEIEIATSIFSPTLGVWTPVSFLTKNHFFYANPQLARNTAGSVLAVWRQNPAGLIYGTITDTDRIMYSFYDNGWNTPDVAVGGIPGLVNLAAGYDNGAATIAYTRYLTPTGWPTPTLQLFTSAWDGITWSTPVQQTDDNLGHRNPQVIYNALNQPLITWIAGDVLQLHNLTTSNTITLTLPSEIGDVDEFHTVQDRSGNIAAVFTAQASQRDLFVAFIDQAHNLWGNPVRLTNDRASEAYPAASLDNTGRLLMGYASTAIQSITQTTTISGTGEVVTYTLPVEGQTDLVTLSHIFGRNLTISDTDLSLSNDHPLPGDSIWLSATVHNTGDLAVDNVTVGVYDGDPATSGTLVGNQTTLGPLAAGFSTTLAVSYTVPVTGGSHILYVVVDPANTISESNKADNVAKLDAFGPDLLIDDASVDYWGGSDVELVTLIRNIGTTSAPTATLSFYNGVLIVTDTLPSLLPQGIVTLTTPWNFGVLPVGVYTLTVIVNQGDFSETFTSNNVFTFTFDVRPDLMVSPYYLWTTSPTGTNVIYTATVFNVGAYTATNVLAGVYGDDRLNTQLDSQTIPVLGIGSSVIISGQVAGPLACTLYVYLDPNQAIDEVTRSNNLAGIMYRGMCQRLYLPIVFRGQ